MAETVTGELATRDDPHLPPGWSYNPSSWPQRLPIVAAWRASASSSPTTWRCTSLGVVSDGLGAVLRGRQPRRSSTRGSRAAAAGLRRGPGAFGYLLDAVAGVIGGDAPVADDALAGRPVRVLRRPARGGERAAGRPPAVLFDSWCTLCLVTAVISIVMIGPAMDEVLASLQHLQARAAGRAVGVAGVLGAGDRTGPGRSPHPAWR